MSVMSLRGGAGAGGPQVGSKPPDPYATVNRIGHPAQRRSGGGSSLGSSPGQPYAESQHAQAIQKITITEKMHQAKSRAAGGAGASSGSPPRQRHKYPQHEPAGHGAPSPSSL